MQHKPHPKSQTTLRNKSKRGKESTITCPHRNGGIVASAVNHLP